MGISILAWMLVVAVLYFTIKFGGKDDTDGDKASGLALYTDYGTGNQYIGGFMTTPTPRLDKYGKQVNIYHNPIDKE